MIEQKYHWVLDQPTISEDFMKWSKKAKIDSIAAKILWGSGIKKPDQVDRILNPSLQDLHDPLLLHDMARARDRIIQAIENQEKILIYGDYDADGMTAASILKTALDELGGDDITQVYLPNRFTDGYGPNLEVYQYFIEKEKIELIITVDNGVAGYDPIFWAQETGIDVIVTDHHSLPDKLPPAYALVHPRHPQGTYPFDDLCGAGVAFKLACALLDSIPIEMLDLVAIGTIADMVSLRLDGENRILVAQGIKQLRNTDRAGLLALIKVAGLDLAEIDEETIGFQLAPRLNSLGRLGDPNPAIELLTGWDEEEAEMIAHLIDESNKERRLLVDQIMEEAQSMLTDAPVQILYRKNWNKGVLGIVAGRLVEETGKPTLVLAQENEKLKGSARSTPALNLFQALNANRDLLSAFGGHSQAAGMTLPIENVTRLQEALANFIQDKGLDLGEKEDLRISDRIHLDQISLDTIRSLKKLSPFGMDHPKPRFLFEDFQIIQGRSMGTSNSHLKLKLDQKGMGIDAIYFGHGSELLEFEQADLDLVVTLASNTWNGQTNVQLMIEDVRLNGVEILDMRTRQMNLPNSPITFSQNQIKNGIINDVLVVADAPEDSAGLARLRKLIRDQNFKRVIFVNAMKNQYYLTGAGSRDQYVALYKAISTYPEFDVRHKLKDLAAYLKIPQILLVKMIQVFEDLGFVRIDDGVMTRIDDAPHREIGESKVYQNLRATLKQQEFFALAPVKDIYKKLKKG